MHDSLRRGPYLFYFYLYIPAAGHGYLGYGYLQNPVLEVRLYGVSIHHVREAEGPLEGAVEPLHPQVVLRAEVLLEPSLALEGYDVLIDLDRHVAYLYPRELGLEYDIFFGLVDVDGGEEGGARKPGGTPVSSDGLVEDAAHALLQEEQIFKWVPPSKGQGKSSACGPALKNRFAAA